MKTRRTHKLAADLKPEPVDEAGGYDAREDDRRVDELMEEVAIELGNGDPDPTGIPQDKRLEFLEGLATLVKLAKLSASELEADPDPTIHSWMAN